MIDRIFDNIARTVNHRPKLVVGIIGVVFIIALVGMTMITMQTGNDTYLDKIRRKVSRTPSIPIPLRAIPLS